MARDEFVVVAVVDVDVVDDDDDDDEDELPDELELLPLLLPFLLAACSAADDDVELPASPVVTSVVVVLLPSVLLVRDFDFNLLLSESELVDESSVGGNFGFGLTPANPKPKPNPNPVVAPPPPPPADPMPTPVLANECRFIVFDLPAPCGLRGGIGVQGRLLLLAAASCAARTASISDSGAL